MGSLISADVPVKNKIDRFIDANCRKCKLQKPKMKKARCDLWHGMDTMNDITITNLFLFWNDDGTCKFIQDKEGVS